MAVGLDARGREVAVRGWREGSGLDLLQLADRFADAGVAALVVTEIGRDGTLEGPDHSGLAEVLAASAGPGDRLRGRRVRSVTCGPWPRLQVDGRRLTGAIVGRALYEGAFGVADAVAACSGADTAGADGGGPG